MVLTNTAYVAPEQHPVSRPSDSAPGRTVEVLVVEDAPETQQLLEHILMREGYAVTLAGSGKSALERLQTMTPDVIVLDLRLPDIDGMDLCRQLRRQTDAYILIASARDTEDDRIEGLLAGADDYMTKPFSLRELATRVQVMLRRPRQAFDISDTVRQFGALHIDTRSRIVQVDGAEVSLTKIEFDLLDTLTTQPLGVCTRGMLIERVWGPGWFGDSHVVNVHMANLRRKIDRDGHKWITTVRGVGYRLASDFAETAPSDT